MIQLIAPDNLQTYELNSYYQIIDFKRKFDMKNPILQQTYLRVPKNDINMCLFLILRDNQTMQKYRNEFVQTVKDKKKRQAINNQLKKADFTFQQQLESIKERSIVSRFLQIGPKILQKYEIFKQAEAFYNLISIKQLPQLYFSTYFKFEQQWINNQQNQKSVIIYPFKQNQQSTILGVFRFRNPLLISQFNEILGEINGQQQQMNYQQISQKTPLINTDTIYLLILSFILLLVLFDAYGFQQSYYQNQYKNKKYQQLTLFNQILIKYRHFIDKIIIEPIMKVYEVVIYHMNDYQLL